MTTPVTATPANVPLLDLPEHNAPFAEPLQQRLSALLESGAFILGPSVEAFEQDLATYTQTKHAFGVSSGTDGIMLALMALGIGPGDEVITTPFTWFSTASCIARVGATPVFVDVNKRTYNLDAELIEGAITPKTKAIMPVHLYGLPASLAPMKRLAEKHGLFLIEDAAQALGARYHDQPVGGLSDVGILSFYPTKNLSAMGDAGAVITQNDELAHRIATLRNHGLVPSGPTGYHFPEIGGNFRMDAIQAELLRLKLSHLDDWNIQRRKNAKVYHHAFMNLPISTPFEPDTRYHVYHQYTIRVRAGQRDAVLHHLKACYIDSKVFYARPLHLQPCFAHLGYRPGMLPVAETAAQEVLSLPISPELKGPQQQRVIEGVRDFFLAE